MFGLFSIQLAYFVLFLLKIIVVLNFSQRKKYQNFPDMVDEKLIQTCFITRKLKLQSLNPSKSRKKY